MRHFRPIIGTLALAWLLLHVFTIEWRDTGPYTLKWWGAPLPWVRHSFTTSLAWEISLTGLIVNGGLAMLLAKRLRRPRLDAVVILAALAVLYWKWGVFFESGWMWLYGEWEMGAAVGICWGATC
jgi:hypothetical protein